MQKKIIALAVAGLMSGAAFAQSNVTVYGLLDMGYTHGSGDGMKTSGINSNINDTSRIGFKGAEDLGNGIKAIFQLEYAISPDLNQGIGAAGNNYTSAAARDTFVGLTGGFGTVVAGRLTAPGDGVNGGYDSTDASNTLSALATIQPYSTMSARLNNAVAYVSPSLSGFTFVGAYSYAGFATAGGDATAFGGSLATNKDQERVLGFRASYDNGPLSVGYAYHRATDIANVSGDDVHEYQFGGSYDFGVAKIMATYQKADYTNDALTAFAGTEPKTYSLGATAPVGANGLVRLQYAKTDFDAGGSDKSKAYSIRYDHNLSKRTFVYGGYIHVSNDNGVPLANSILGTSATITAGESNSAYAVGIHHVF